jgi:hypothetical protein
MPPKKRGFKFTTNELENLAKAVADIIPMSNTNTDWDNILEIHDANFPGLNRTSDSRFLEAQISGDCKDKNPHR